jgi:hypothetical protein
LQDDLDARARRAAKKQSVYREVNERIESLAGPEYSAVFVCECLREECDERISLSLKEYEQIRSSPNRFIVVPGHERSEAEVVQTTDRYHVVRNVGAGAEVAEELDPRTGEAAGRPK